MAGLFTVADGFTNSVHPTLFPHQVSELSETEQRERLKNAFFDCFKKINSDPVTLTGRLSSLRSSSILVFVDSVLLLFVSF